MSPAVTVLMPVYNGEKYLDEAVESILKQTYADFEFLIINDGSTDGSAGKIKSYHDPRVRFEENGGNLGLIATLNKGIESAKGRYIARMDCDDFSLPQRLERQAAFMEKNPEVAVCGSWVETMGERSEVWQYPASHDEISCKLLFESAIAHPAAMMRAGALRRDNIRYDPAFKHAEDFELWVNLSGRHRLANIGEVLLRYRIHRDKIGSVYRQEQLAVTKLICKRELEKLGISASESDLALHRGLALSPAGADEEFLLRARDWLAAIERANGETHVFDEGALRKELSRRWLALCAGASISAARALKIFFSSHLSKNNRKSFLLSLGLRTLKN